MLDAALIQYYCPFTGPPTTRWTEEVAGDKPPHEETYLLLPPPTVLLACCLSWLSKGLKDLQMSSTGARKLTCCFPPPLVHNITTTLVCVHWEIWIHSTDFAHEKYKLVHCINACEYGKHTKCFHLHYQLFVVDVNHKQKWKKDVVLWKTIKINHCMPIAFCYKV